MDYSDIRKIVEETDPARVQIYLDTRRWILLDTAPGRDAEGRPYFLYSLGWYGPYDPEFPEDDASEFPVFPVVLD